MRTHTFVPSQSHGEDRTNLRLNKGLERQSTLFWIAQGLANMAWGFAKVELHDEAFFDLLALRTVEGLESCRPKIGKLGEWLLTMFLDHEYLRS